MSVKILDFIRLRFFACFLVPAFGKGNSSSRLDGVLTELWCTLRGVLHCDNCNFDALAFPAALACSWWSDVSTVGRHLSHQKLFECQQFLMKNEQLKWI